MKLEITYTGTLVVTPDHDDDVVDPEVELERVFDATMQELLKLNAVDPSVSGSAATGEIEISLVEEGRTMAAIVTSADSLIRSALHCAGVSTPGWMGPGRYGLSFRRMEVDDTAEDLDGELSPA